MDIGFGVAAGLLPGLALGLAIGGATYARELARMARFLRRRDPASNARMTVNAAGPGLTDLAAAVNDDLDRAAEDHVRAIRAQQDFQRDLSALSHDIRTPLMGAKGYLQLAREEEDGAARDRDLAAAQARIDATNALLDQLFAFTKASDPDLAPEIAPVAVRPLVEAILLANYPAFEERGWEPAVHFADDDLVIEADRALLERILENLVVNAVRHGAGATAIEQQGRALTISNRVSRPDLIDTDRLFDRFYQADAARAGGGTGLGLATAAKLAQSMGLSLTAALDGDTLRITLAA